MKVWMSDSRVVPPVPGPLARSDRATSQLRSKHPIVADEDLASLGVMSMST